MNHFTFFTLALILLFYNISFSQTSFGSAIDFDGYGDYANTLNDPYFLTPNGTLEAWVKVRSITAQIGNVFFEKNEEQWNKGDFYIFFETTSGKIKARIQSFPSKPPIQADIASDMSFWNSYNIWAHVAFTWGSNGMRMFINGDLQTNHNSVRNSAMNNTCNFYVGADGYMLHNGSYVVSNFFDGQIDELRIWNYQKTSDEIISLWDSPLDSAYFTTIDSGLVGYWRFDDLEDLGINNDGPDDVRDFSALHNHLDLAGDAHLVQSNIIIPVELVSFTADVFGKQVRLQWKTSSELNNLGFEIERKSGIFDWRTIGFIEGKGTTTEIQRYTFIDDLFVISSDNFSYRLKQLDYDGSFSYSDEIEVDLNPTFFELFQNYPNPFNPTTSIEYSISNSLFVTLKIYDVLGNEVLTLVNKEMHTGNYKVEFNASGLPSGVYFYSLQAGEFFDVKNMILLK